MLLGINAYSQSVPGNILFPGKEDEDPQRIFRTMRELMLCAVFLGLVVGRPPVGMAQDSPKQDLKDAGHDTADAAKDTGRATKHAAQKTGHAIKKGTNKAAEKTEDGARNVKNKTDPD